MKKNGFLIPFVLTGALFGSHDVSVTYNFMGGEAQTGTNKLTEWVNGIVLRYSGAVPLSENFGLFLGEEFDGITKAAECFPGRAVNLPVGSRGSLGMEYIGFGCMRIQGISQMLINSLENDFPVYFKSVTPHTDARMIQRYKNGADFYWHLPVDRMDIITDVTYTNLRYDYYRLDEKLADQSDADVWFNGSIALPMLEDKVQVLAKGFGKHDLNEYGGYNLANVSLGLGSDFMLFKRKLQGYTELMPRYYENSIMRERGYADGLGICSHARLFYKLKPRTFLKGDLEYELAPVGAEWYFKQRYELAFRNVWKNRSSLEMGGWGTLGALFPRICGYVKSDIVAGPKLSILPGARAYLLWEENWTKTGIGEELTLLSSGYSYYRTDMELMLRYVIGTENSNFFKHLAVQGGAGYRIFDWDKVLDPPYINTMRLFLGLTNYL